MRKLQGTIESDEEKSCMGKDRFTSESAAVAALRFYQRQRTLRTNGGLGVYACRFCQGWHHGHDRPPARRDTRRVGR